MAEIFTFATDAAIPVIELTKYIPKGTQKTQNWKIHCMSPLAQFKKCEKHTCKTVTRNKVAGFHFQL